MSTSFPPDHLYYKYRVRQPQSDWYPLKATNTPAALLGETQMDFRARGGDLASSPEFEHIEISQLEFELMSS